MATLGASMVTLLTDNWAGAGATPTFGFLIDFQMDLAPTTEQVLVRLPIHEDVDPVNDLYSNFKFTMQLRVKSTVSEDRLKVLTDETIRIINTYAITGITRQFAKRGENTSDRKQQVFSYDVWATLEEHMSTAGTSYSSPGAGDVVFPADVTVTDDFGFDTGETVDVILDEDNMASDDENALATQQSIKKYIDDVVLSDLDTTLTGAYLEDLLMFGSANAAWVPCMYVDHSNVNRTYIISSGTTFITNRDGTNASLRYDLPKPSIKGALKLYITGSRVVINDADAAAFVTQTRVFGATKTGLTTLNTDGTDYNSQDDWDDTFAAADCSGYDAVYLWLDCDVDAGNELDIVGCLLRCYYAA